MKDKDFLRRQQIEEAVKPFRDLITANPPRRGWVKAMQEALGMTNVQLAKRLKLKAQTIEDMQTYEARGTIKLDTLRKLAEALGCRVVYAVVPLKPIDEIRRARASEVARQQLRHVFHSMNLENQGVGSVAEQKEIERLTEELLAGNPKKLWE